MGGKIPILGTLALFKLEPDNIDDALLSRDFP